MTRLFARRPLVWACLVLIGWVVACVALALGAEMVFG